MYRLLTAALLTTGVLTAGGGHVHAQAPACTITEVVIPISANGGSFESTSVPAIFLQLTSSSGAGAKSIDFSIDQSQGPAGILQVFVDWISVDEQDVIVDRVAESFNFGGTGVTNNTFSVDDPTFDSWGATARFQVCALQATTTAGPVTTPAPTTPAAPTSAPSGPVAPPPAAAPPAAAPPAAALPSTGIESTTGWWAAALLAAGTLMVWASRRRTPRVGS